MPPRRERKLQLRESAIIAAAARLIEQVGYAGLTMDMLADAVGIAKPTLYQHFRSKDDVLIASSLTAMEALAAFMDGLTGTAVSQLEAIMRHMMTFSSDADGAPSLILHDEMLHLFRGHAAVEAWFEALNARLFRLIEAAKADGAIAPDLSSAAIVTLMMTAIGARSGGMVYPDQSGHMLIDHIVRIVFNGLRP